MDMSLSAIIAHVKELENDNSTNTTLLQRLIKRFTYKYAENIDCENLITSATVAVTTTDYSDLTLSANFLRPLTSNSFWLSSDRLTKYTMYRLSTGVDLSSESDYNQILYIKGNCAKIKSANTGTLEYWYIRKPNNVALSATPDIPAEYLIEGARAYYQNAMGYISKADMDSYIYQILLQAKMDTSAIDKKMNAYVYIDPQRKLGNNFRG